MKGHKDVQGFGAPDRWRRESERAVTPHLGEETAQEDLINVHKYLGGNEEVGGRLFSLVPPDWTGGGGHKLKHRKSCLNLIKKKKKRSGQIQEQVAQRDDEDVQSQTGYSPDLSALVDSPLSWVLD